MKLQNNESYKKIIFFQIFITFFLLTCFNANAEQKCIPDFPYKEGWLGGDGAFSIPISEDKTIWLFGDTFIGKENKKTRKNSKMIANTIGLSDCNQNQFSINYYWNKDSQNPFFKTSKTNEKYWPAHGFTYNDKLYIALERISSKKDENNTFNFKIEGVDLAIIDNPTESPDKWKITYTKLMNDETIIPGIAFVKKDNYLYIFSVLEGEKYKDHPLILLRMQLEKILNPKVNLEYYSKEDLWKKGINLADSKIILDKASTEISVSFNPYINKWIMIHGKSEFLTRQIAVRVSDNLEGSWDNVQYFDIYKDMNKNSLFYDKDTFCYAAKEHNQFSKKDDENLVITYACNSFNFWTLLGNMKLYYPKVIKLPVSDFYDIKR